MNFRETELKTENDLKTRALTIILMTLTGCKFYGNGVNHKIEIWRNALKQTWNLRSWILLTISDVSTRFFIGSILWT